MIPFASWLWGSKQAEIQNEIYDICEIFFTISKWVQPNQKK